MDMQMEDSQNGMKFSRNIQSLMVIIVDFLLLEFKDFYVISIIYLNKHTSKVDYTLLWMRSRHGLV